MRKLYTLLTAVFTITLAATAQDVESYDHFDEFYEALVQHPDQKYVVNFWATWCAPCVKELPYFEELQKKHGDDVQVVLVSLDFKKQLEKRLLPFLQKNPQSSRLIHLTDSKTNVWIDKVDPSWSGAIPATVFIKGKKVAFFEKAYESYEELEEEVKKAFP